MHDHADLEIRRALSDQEAERAYMQRWAAQQQRDLETMRRRPRWPWYKRLAAWLRRQWI